MEIMASPATTTTNNTQKELRLYGQTDHQTNATTSLAQGKNGASSPFQREVREWQRIDPDTGALLTGRLEADRWINGPHNSYGKISDSQNISQPNGTQQTQRKQLEVIQTCTAGGAAMQVIRSQTVQTTSSRWSSSSTSPSPPSLMQLSSALSSSSSRAPKDKYSIKTNKHQATTQKRTNTNSTKTNSNSNATNSNTTSTTSTPFMATNGIHHNHHQTHNRSKFHPSTSTKSSSKSTTTSLSTANLVNGRNNKNNVRRKNWPQIVTESTALEICDNEHDNDHQHDNDYTVHHASDIDEENYDEANDDDIRNKGVTGDIYTNDDNHSNHDNDSLADHINIESEEVYRLTNFPTFSMNAFKSDLCHNEEKQQKHHHHHHHQQQHLRADYYGNLDNGHSSSNSSLNSHSGNSCSNTSNQLFLLDTAPSLKLSNLMKSSSSISNSSNNSTTAAPAMTTTMNLNTNTASPTPLSSSMNTHKSRASKISLHAIVGNNTSNTGNSNNNNSNNNVNDHTTKTASSTPSPTTTTTRPSWQQPTIFRQNNNLNNHNTNLNPNQKLNHTLGTSITSSLGQHSSSHLAKTRVGDNNCCGGSSSSSSSNNSSSDESRSPYSTTGANVTADLRHQRQSPTVFNMKLQQNDRLTPTQSQLRQNRVDLESFRHYNNNGKNNNSSISNRLNINDTYVADHNHTNATNTANNYDDAAKDADALRLSSRQLRRQQAPIDKNQSTTALQRSRSISTDDLSTEWNANGEDNEEPAEWRRVSKLRRSFQSSSKPQQSTPTPKRPLDLPTNSVSVSRIRAELENGRRLNTVMKNNHVDLTALSSILNAPDNKSPSLSTKSSFLTAESLKEIRGRLKKLSDESLYKEDFLLNQQTAAQLPEQEHIEVQPTTIRRSVDRSPDRYRMVVNREESPRVSPKHTTNSLESRLKYKEVNPIEWHLRRKSYGFEKMSPPDKSMQRMDASTDSGLGRSGELQNWSPTSDAVTNANRNSTVIHFGESNNRSGSAVTRRYRPQKSYEDSENSHEEDALNKRHSIAVDESQYVRDNNKQTTQVHINGFYNNGSEGKLLNTTSEMSTTTTAFSQRGQQKRVEFCKTEVHFATESGRVNIVETDSKPPPTNNFRRRRSRSSSVGPLQSLVKSATTVSTTSSSSSASLASSAAGVTMPVTLFGDDSLRRKTIATSTVAYRAQLLSSPEPKDSAINVTVTLPESYGHSESSRSSYASTSGVDTTDYETDEMTSLRGILKNKPAKPKPYVLGENIEKPDDLWGVQLKPVKGASDVLGRVKSDSPPLLLTAQKRSVAERIRLVEQQQQEIVPLQTNGFSTKINVSLNTSIEQSNGSSKPWEETGPLRIGTQRRPSVQELLLQDLKEHQRILDEGLKSTTLIIKTMRSASEFDEAMRRLSIASIEANAAEQNIPLIITSNSYPDETTTQNDLNEIAQEPTAYHLYNSTSISSTSSIRKSSPDSRKTSSDSGTSMPHKDSLPRLGLLRNEQLPVSQQLQRLRLIYDAATQGEDDSADEEVKSYFRSQFDSDSGGGTQESSSYEDDQCLENSNSSWSRLKAKKTIWHINMGKSVESSQQQQPLEITDLPKSNVMSIKLHSPHMATEAPAPLKVIPPVAKPRTVTSYQEAQLTPKQQTNASTNANTTTTTTTTKSTAYQSSLPTKDSLKIIKEARGARQLREHELSYFGIPLTKSEHDQLKTKFSTNSSSARSSPKRSLPLRRLSEEKSVNDDQINNDNRQQPLWQLDHDKPDLLKHSPIMPEIRKRDTRPSERKSLKKKIELDEEEEEHLYENIANEIIPVFKVKSSTPPECYDRKMDLKRDAMILSEMNKNADQTLRELSDEAALKDRKRRSLQRRTAKPLETIDEKSITEKLNDACNTVKVARGTFASEAKKTSRHSTPSPSRVPPTRERTSSQSSVESCPRARSRSLSSEKEYESNKAPPPTRPMRSTHKSLKPLAQLRSSSLDSHRSYNSHYSSGEEQQQQQQQHQHLRSSFRREDRSRNKTKRNVAGHSSSLHQESHKQRDDKPPRPSQSESKRLSSTTHSSSHKERVECSKDNVAGSAIISTPPAHSRRHNGSVTNSTSATSSALQRSTASGGSGRRLKDESRDSQRVKRSSAMVSGRSASETRERKEPSSKNTPTRQRREDERNSSARSSGHRLERGDKDKDKSSRSKAHSSRSTHHQHHERSTPTANLATTTTITKDVRHKSASTTAAAAAATADNTTHSKNAQTQPQHPHQSQHHQQQHSTHMTSKERTNNRHQQEQKPTQQRSCKKREEDTPKHLYGLKSAIIKTTTKLRDKSRARKEKK